MTTAGFHHRSAAPIYLGIKLILFAVSVIAGSSLVAATDYSMLAEASVVLVAAFVFFHLPNLVVFAARSRRQGEVRSHLPDAIDLLEICVSSGMGIDMAWNSVADEIRRVSITLSDEMVLANLEIHLGAPRPEAMRNMARRTGSHELTSLVSVLIQTERFGTSISDALRSFATSMREKRRQRAEEVAEKVAVKLLFPMIMFIFPAVFVVTAGPAAIRILQMMNQV